MIDTISHQFGRCLPGYLIRRRLHYRRRGGPGYYAAGGLAVLFLLLSGVAVAAGQAEREGSGFDPWRMQNIDGQLLPKGKQTQRFKPVAEQDHKGELVVQDLRVHEIINNKGIEIITSTPDQRTAEGEAITYAKVTVRNCEIYNINRDAAGAAEGMHLDFLRIAGGGDQQPIETDVLVEDVYIHDGNVLPLIIQDGRFGSITLRRVRVEHTANGGVQLGFINSGHVREVIVEESPGLVVHLMGRPGSIEKVVVRDSPGADVRDTQTAKGRSGARITIETPAQRVVLAAQQMAAKEPPATPRLQVKVDAKGMLRATVNDVPADAACVAFTAFDSFGYRFGAPVVVCRGPWEAALKVTRRGRIIVQATITRVGGDAGKALVETVEIE